MKPPEPFGFHKAVLPLESLRHKILSSPFPVKSPVPTTCQLVGTLLRFSSVKPPEPFGFHKAVLPLAALRHKIPSPAPVKSPVPTTCQLVGTLLRFSSVKPPEPFGFHKAVLPLVPLRHKILASFAPLKAPVPTIASSWERCSDSHP